MCGLIRRRRSHPAYALLLVVLLTASCASPDPAEAPIDETGEGEPSYGRFAKLRRTEPDGGGDRDLLRSLGYVGATNLAETDLLVTVHDPRAQEGFGLYTSGHGPEAFLIDKSGRELHRWRKEVGEVWPDAPPVDARRHYFRDAEVYPNGDLLVMYADAVPGLLRLDRDSNVVWSNRELWAHHALEVQPGGGAYLLTRRIQKVPDVDPDARVVEDFITAVDADGNVVAEVSLIRALLDSEFRSWWDGRARECAGEFATREGCRDLLHANSVQVLDGRFAHRHPAFRSGNVLTSFRSLDSIAVVDMEREELVWMHSGSYRAQHDPRLLENGNVLVFDNRGRRRQSSVQEIDPRSGETVWVYRGTEQHPFYSKFCGTADRLANGNTLITESESGRAFEVTREGEIVWEFFNPNRAGDDDEYVGVLFEMVHLGPDFPVHWARARGAASP